MNTAAIVTFVLIAGLVWGGLALFVRHALRSERTKAGHDGGDAG